MRFGDGKLGRRPGAGAAFHAYYRIGNGPEGNVGRESISLMVTGPVSISGAVREIRNPLPAQGGVRQESMDEVKLLAPGAFRQVLQRAVTAEDYAALALRDFARRLQNAAATLRWNGSSYEALVVVDPRGEESPEPALLEEIASGLQRYRRVNHEIAVEPALRVPLEIRIRVCVLPHFRPDAVKQTLLDLFGTRRLADGRLGFFHPDNLTFGGGIYLSRLVALAQSVPGVESAWVTLLRRYRQPATNALDSGVLTLGPLEIAQAANDPNFPEHGSIEVIVS